MKIFYLFDKPGRWAAVSSSMGFVIAALHRVYHTVLDVVFQDHFGRVVDGGFDGGKLNQHFAAVAAIFHHAFDGLHVADGRDRRFRTWPWCSGGCGCDHDYGDGRPHGCGCRLCGCARIPYHPARCVYGDVYAHSCLFFSFATSFTPIAFFLLFCPVYHTHPEITIRVKGMFFPVFDL